MFRASDVLVAIALACLAGVGTPAWSYDWSLAASYAKLFAWESLERIPQDRTVVVLFKSGTRATAASVALRHVRFPKVFFLAGGSKAVSDYLDPKTANTPPSEVTTNP